MADTIKVLLYVTQPSSAREQNKPALLPVYDHIRLIIGRDGSCNESYASAGLDKWLMCWTFSDAIPARSPTAGCCQTEEGPWMSRSLVGAYSRDSTIPFTTSLHTLPPRNDLELITSSSFEYSLIERYKIAD